MAAAHDKPIALVTGGARGIGRAIVERFCADGFSVGILDREVERATALVADLTKAGHSAFFEPIDLADHDGLVALAERLPAAQALVNNAGVFENKPFFELAAGDFRGMMDVNVTALFLLSQAVARRMETGGRIVNIASRTFLGARNHAHYVASKAAVVGLTRAMAMELLPRGIAVNAVAPGAVATEMVAKQSEEARAALLAQQPTGALAAPEDIANAVAFLASPRTNFIYGQVLLVDGGKSLGGGMGI
ncbi:MULTISPECIES: SDR family NAD(P)-dependent oxidoreductase [unclassified Bosea (in: a-proteobacteria)]|uniref:SDR family NAD(P)-dependent oxidoreductase n=1 Tax=unclassified Bosea (in: a-proteobacteria) TaxID=2653178 RepID=UPI000F74DABC|nr:MULTISPECIES: SDR family NAD(P)-dependent oxidoreductase [unclassified Bosea (in: a-proteobacteria)]AZO80664.1 short-chain dehydrogenase [Bosea sp. Tri-49]RXT25626.1 short-chain dehydrogenase [Bosea sp. Tri-39]RXT30867.1 short-chain dehydrogenase [Bosea sp. Tri-54]